MALSDVALRSMTRRDVARIRLLEIEAFSSPWSESMLREEVARSNRIYLVAEDASNKALIGYGGVMLVPPDAHVMTIAVVSKYRRRGVGSLLLGELIDRARAAGAEHVTLEVRPSNAAAQALYSKFGFQPAGRRKAYYGDEDALVMWLLGASRGAIR